MVTVLFHSFGDGQQNQTETLPIAVEGCRGARAGDDLLYGEIPRAAYVAGAILKNMGVGVEELPELIVNGADE